ncbi:MAG TPA: hypothetical protein VNL14_04330 [Candidatus Acidoferrales bacterium]|nr:hypothetical protein [Candidatus Acidoferrales bacterium]
MKAGETPRLEPMTMGGLLDRAFRLYMENCPLMLGITAAAYVPLYAIQLVMEAGIGESGAARHNLTIIFSQLLFMILWMSLALPVATGAATYAISERYLGREVTVGQALGRACRRLWTLTGAQIAVMVRVVIGFLLLLIPGILWWLSYALVVPVVLIEGRKAAPSLRRSWELVKGNRGKVFVVLVVVNALQWLSTFGVRSVSGLAVDLESMTGKLLYTAVSDAVVVFLTPLAIVADILLYYDFRIRKEGFDLEMLSRALANAKNA